MGFILNLKNEWIKKDKKEKMSELILMVNLILTMSLMAIHLFFIFNQINIHMPFWFEWVSFLICTFAFVSSGIPFFKTCYFEIFKWHSLGMSTLISVSSIIAYVYSCYQIIFNTTQFAKGITYHHLYDFSHTAAMIVVIVSVGESISNHLRKKTTNDLKKISEIQIGKCLLYENKTKQTKEIDVKDVRIGDFLLVKKATKIPVDGIIIEGDSDFDEAHITGESKPVHKKVNDYVIGASNNLTNTIVMKATAVGKNTLINQIIKNVNFIAAQKPKYQKIVDKVCKYFVVVILLLSLLAFLLHLFYDDINKIQGVFNNWFNIENNVMFDKVYLAFFYAIGTLAIACPCALGIAAPVASLVGASKAAKNGIVINTSETYEKIKKIDVVVFDKTGTLTNGKMDVVKIVGNQKNLPIIYEMEKLSIHPIGLSLINYFEKNDFKFNNITSILNAKEIAGVGISCEVKKDKYLVSSLKYTIDNNFSFAKDVKEELASMDQKNKVSNLTTIVCLSKNNNVENIIVLSDSISDNAHDAITLFKSLKIETCITSGDNENAVAEIAKDLNINEFYANIKPHEKAEIIKKIQNRNKIVAYVGDGINDLEALKQADLSIAISKDNKIAQSVSDITILNHDIINIIKAIEITKQTRRMIIFNLIWAFAYNIITLPLSIIGFIPPFIGVFIMATSDVTVILNSLYFKMKKIRYIKKENYLHLKNKSLSQYISN